MELKFRLSALELSGDYVRLVMTYEVKEPEVKAMPIAKSDVERVGSQVAQAYLNIVKQSFQLPPAQIISSYITLLLTMEEYNRFGRPTVGDEISVTFRVETEPEIKGA